MTTCRFPPPWSVDIFTYRNYCAGADPMTLTNAPPGSGLFVLLALVLTVATIWLLLHAIETRPKEIDAQSFLVLIIVIIPFVMVIYFGLATIICNEIVAARSGRPILPLELLSLRKIVPATVTYIGLSTWTLGRKTLRQVARGNDNLKPIELALVAIGCVRLR